MQAEASQMTIQIELTSEEEEILKEAASQEGLDASTFVRIAVFEKAERASRKDEGTDEPLMLDKMLAGLTGLVRSNEGRGGSRLSESTGADYAADLLQKRSEG
jgi:hypothetical protein